MRYDLRRDRSGWTVFDRWTGQTVVLGRSEQCGLPLEAARSVIWNLGSTPGALLQGTGRAGESWRSAPA